MRYNIIYVSALRWNFVQRNVHSDERTEQEWTMLLKVTKSQSQVSGSITT